MRDKMHEEFLRAIQIYFIYKLYGAEHSFAWFQLYLYIFWKVHYRHLQVQVVMKHIFNGMPATKMHFFVHFARSSAPCSLDNSMNEC